MLVDFWQRERLHQMPHQMTNQADPCMRVAPKIGLALNKADYEFGGFNVELQLSFWINVHLKTLT